MPFTIRPPHAAEAEALAELHLRTWEETYAGQFPPSAWGPDARAQRIRMWTAFCTDPHHGSGAGQALLDAVVDGGPASLWVLEENPRARAFYERNGFRADGERRPTGFDDGGDEIRMLR